MPSRPKKRKVVQVLTSPANDKVVPEGQRCCPICQAPMRTSTRDGETIDVCDAHGIWLDRFELERIALRRLRRTGGRLRRVKAKTHAEGVAEGLFWGSLLS